MKCWLYLSYLMKMWFPLSFPLLSVTQYFAITHNHDQQRNKMEEKVKNIIQQKEGRPATNHHK